MDGRSLVGDELVRRRVRVSYVQWLRSSRGRMERIGRWPGSRWLRRSGRRGQGRTAAVVTAKGISGCGRLRRGRCSGFGASERSGLDLLEGEGDGAAAGHGQVTRRRRWLRLRRRGGSGCVGHGGGRRGRGAGDEWRCPGARGRDVEVVQLVHGRGGKQVAPWRARARRRHLSACSGESKQLTGHGPAQCWAARWAAR